MAETADQPITGLPTKTASGIVATDKLLGIDSAEGYQMLIKDLGDYIIQNAPSSLMGSSQTIASAFNTLNSNWGTPINARQANVNYDNMVTPGVYLMDNTCTNGPESGWHILRVTNQTAGTISRILQEAYRISSSASAQRVSYRVMETNTWISWQLLPNYSDFEALNSNSAKVQYKSSGSLKDIKTTGIHYLTSTVTDKPDASGGLYICFADSSSNVTGLYVPLYGNDNHLAYVVRALNNDYSSYKPQQIKRTTITATTTATGAVQIGNINGHVISVHYADAHVGNVYIRDNESYFTCLDSSNAPLVNTEVTLLVTYYDGNL